MRAQTNPASPIPRDGRSSSRPSTPTAPTTQATPTSDAQVFVGSLSLLLGGLMALMLRSHGEAPLWIVSELSAVLCLLLYLWAYHVTQNLTSGAVVPVESLVFSFPLVFGAGLLIVAVDPLAGVLVMGADVACMSAFFDLCLGEYVRYDKLPASANR